MRKGDLNYKMRENDMKRRKRIPSPTGQKKSLYHGLIKKKNLHPHYKTDEPQDSNTGLWQKIEVQR